MDNAHLCYWMCIYVYVMYMFKFASLLSNFLIQSPFRHLCKVLLDTKILFVSPQYHDLIFILGSSKQFKIKKLLNVNDTSASLLLRVGN